MFIFMIETVIAFDSQSTLALTQRVRLIRRSEKLSRQVKKMIDIRPLNAFVLLTFACLLTFSEVSNVSQCPSSCQCVRKHVYTVH